MLSADSRVVRRSRGGVRGAARSPAAELGAPTAARPEGPHLRLSEPFWTGDYNHTENK